MKAVEIGAFEAKTKFAELLEKVARGHEFLITRRGKPIARLISQERRDAGADRRARAWELYQRIQKSGRRISRKQLDESIRESRAELLQRTEKILS